MALKEGVLVFFPALSTLFAASSTCRGPNKENSFHLAPKAEVGSAGMRSPSVQGAEG